MIKNSINFDDLYRDLDVERVKVGGDECLKLSNGWYLLPLQYLDNDQLTGDILVSTNTSPDDPLLGAWRTVLDPGLSLKNSLDANDLQIVTELQKRVKV